MGAIGDRHNAGHDGNIYIHCHTVVHKTKVSIRVVEILRDGRIRASIGLALEIIEIVLRVFRLRMNLRIGRDFDMKPIAGLLTNESHQLVRIAKLAGVGHA